jgi:hypothetical protein
LHTRCDPIHVDFDPAVVGFSLGRCANVGHHFKFQWQGLIFIQPAATGNVKPAVVLAIDKVDGAGDCAIVVHLKAQFLPFAGTEETKIQHGWLNNRGRQLAATHAGAHLGRAHAQPGIGFVDLLQLSFGIDLVERIAKAIRMINAHQLFIPGFDLFLRGSEWNVEYVVVIFHAATSSGRPVGEWAMAPTMASKIDDQKLQSTRKVFIVLGSCNPSLLNVFRSKAALVQWRLVVGSLL